MNTYYITSSDNPTSDIRITESIGTDPTTNTFEVPFKVVAPTTATVELLIKKATDSTWAETVSASVGDDIQLQWKTYNATSCNLTYDGTTYPNVIFENGGYKSTTINSIKKDTTFTISCAP